MTELSRVRDIPNYSAVSSALHAKALSDCSFLSSLFVVVLR